MMVSLCRVRHPLILLALPILVLSNQASFDLEKSLSSSCELHCYNGVCLNGSCVCTKGWTGPQCDHCHGRIRLSENQSTLSDGPLKYSPSSKCTWIIESEKDFAAPLTIRLDNFHTECGWDFLYIYDGDGIHGNQLAAFCGEQPVQELIAPSGKALIYFYSDLAINLDGFNISYEFNRCPYNCSDHGSCIGNSCKCDAGYTGKYCETEQCTAMLDGESGPCKNKGNCLAGSCSCNYGYHGEYCQESSTVSVWDELLTSNAPAGRASHASVLIDDTIWTVGGEHFDGIAFEDVVVYNITTRTFTVVKPTSTDNPSNRYDHSLVRYKNKLYMFGGVIDRKNVTGELWSFDLHSNSWHLESDAGASLAEPPLAISGHSAHAIGSEMLAFFGYHPRVGLVHQVQIYNFDTQEWRFGKSKDHVFGRFGHSSIHYESEQGDVVLVYGGTMWSSSQSNNVTDSLIQYSIKQEKWINLPASGVHVFLHTASFINGLMVVVGGNGYDSSNARAKQECFSEVVQVYDVACKQWFNISSPPASLKRYGHTSLATKDDLYVFGGFNGRMLNDVIRFSPADCKSITRPEKCRNIFDGVKCVFAEGSCQKFDPFVSYKPSFLSFVKNESPKSVVQCRSSAVRQSYQNCEDVSDCVTCASTSGCGWCPSGDQCLPSDGYCLDGQIMLTAWEKCPSSRDAVLPRPCSMASSCHSCKLLPYCNWFAVDHKLMCISLEEEAILLSEQHSRDLDRLGTSSALSLRHPQLPQATILNSTQCLPACADISECGDCIANDKCIWCMDRCINMEAYTLSFAYGQCHSWITGSTPGGAQKSCAQASLNCIPHKTCAECQLSPQCGWLDIGSGTGLGECQPGTVGGPLTPPEGFQQENWYFLKCPACQCNGHTKCNKQPSLTMSDPVHEVCGECQNNTTGKHCELCAPGYYGDPRNGGKCEPCQCNGQADSCDPFTGHCHCRTKGVIGKYCDKCDAKYYGSPRNGTPCYYELAVDFIFTFKLKKEDKDRHATEIYLFSIPYKRDTDVTFQISCEPPARVTLNETSSYLPIPRNRSLFIGNVCDQRGIRRIYSASEADGWAFGTDLNTTFFVQVYNFTTPIVIQVSFAQSPPINWVLFFVIFAACFIVLLVVAGLLWMIKLRIEVYRRNQRRIDEIEHMASRPFANVKLELSTPHSAMANSPTPLSVEPCSNYKAGVFTLAVRLPTGGRATTPNGTSGLAVASALCQLTPAQLGVLQAPENSDNKHNSKTNVRRYIPFLRNRPAGNA